MDGRVGELWGVGEERPDGPDAPDDDRVPADVDPPRAGQHAERRLPRPAAVAIPRDRPVILRYRIVLHRGELAPAEIERLQAEYAAERITLN